MDEKIVIQQKPPKSPVLAGLLSLIPFGTGAFYNGQYLKGLIYMLTFIGLISSPNPVQGLLIAGFVIFQFFETIQAAKTINQAGAEPKTDDLAKAAVVPQLGGSGSIFWGIILIALGLLIILMNFSVVPWETIWHFWPVLVIVFGLRLIYGQVRMTKGAK
jgi:hypothetical protein